MGKAAAVLTKMATLKKTRSAGKKAGKQGGSFDSVFLKIRGRREGHLFSIWCMKEVAFARKSFVGAFEGFSPALGTACNIVYVCTYAREAIAVVPVEVALTARMFLSCAPAIAVSDKNLLLLLTLYSRPLVTCGYFIGKKV